MLRLWSLCLLCIGAAAASMIQLRDKNFDDEDKQLDRLLKERMQGHTRDSKDFTMTPDQEMKMYFEDKVEYTFKVLEGKIMNAAESKDKADNYETRRQATPATIQELYRKDIGVTQDEDGGKQIVGIVVPENETALRQKNYEFPKVPEIFELKERAMDMMRHQIYATQYRLRDMQKIIDKYSGDLNYRVAYIFCRLETLLFEMNVMHSYVNKTVSSNVAHLHMIYYTYFMKKNIDVTYIVEYMIKTHTDYMDSITMNFKVQGRGNGTSRPEVTTGIPGVGPDGGRPQLPGNVPAPRPADPPSGNVPPPLANLPSHAKA